MSKHFLKCCFPVEAQLVSSSETVRFCPSVDTAAEVAVARVARGTQALEQDALCLPGGGGGGLLVRVDSMGYGFPAVYIKKPFTIFLYSAYT